MHAKLKVMHCASKSFMILNNLAFPRIQGQAVLFLIDKKYSITFMQNIQIFHFCVVSIIITAPHFSQNK